MTAGGVPAALISRGDDMRYALPLLVSLAATLPLLAGAEEDRARAALAFAAQAPRPPQAPTTMTCGDPDCPCGCAETGVCSCGATNATPRIVHAPPGVYFRLPDGSLVTSYDANKYQPARGNVAGWSTTPQAPPAAAPGWPTTGRPFQPAYQPPSYYYAPPAAGNWGGFRMGGGGGACRGGG